MVQPNSQNARILKALADGKWHTSANLQRKSGASRLNSRISELRSRGYEIEHEPVEGKKGWLAHRYRLLNPPEATQDLVVEDDQGLPRDEIPRDRTHRYRIYAMRYEKLELLATATTPADVGNAIVTLGREGKFTQSCVGILDTFGTDLVKGDWVVNPFDSTPLYETTQVAQKGN